MADHFDPFDGRADDRTDHRLDDRLRELARDAEPLVVLAGAEAARARGERRRARRRAGAVSLVAALALAGIGVWQFGPHVGGGQDRTLPAASPTGTTAAPDPTARLDAELLPLSSLPAGHGGTWRVVSAADAAKFPEACPVAPGDSALRAEASRTYLAGDGAVAYYHLFAFGSALAAKEAAATMGAGVKAACAHVPAGHKAEAGGTPGYYLITSGPRTTSVWLDRAGDYVAVLSLAGPGAHGTYTDGKQRYPGAPPWLCIDRSLNRLEEPRADDAPAQPPLGSAGHSTAHSTSHFTVGSGADAAQPPRSALC